MTGLITIINKIGRPPNLLIYKEAYIAETAEMEGTYGLPRCTISLTNDVQQVIHCVGKIDIVYDINSNSTMKYSRRVIEQ